MYSRDDIKKAIRDGHLKIYPFEEKNLTGIGYNLSSTNFAFSINKGILLTIHERISNGGVEHYVIVPPNDTILLFTKEYIATDKTIAGTFHSKVKNVCQGFAHISTTLDPTWKGQLIISFNNPTNKKIEFELDRSTGNIVTMLLYELKSEVTGANTHDNNQGRCDLLLNHFSHPGCFFWYRKKHLELKEFIRDQFANSLNGCDDFIHDKTIDDEYSQKLVNLTKMLERLKKHVILFDENRYVIGKDGKYYMLAKDEIMVLESCVLYKTMNICTKALSNGYSNILEERNNILEELSKMIAIVEYEIEMINHLRRIEWQEKQISKFADAKSSLVKVNRRNAWMIGAVQAVVVISLAVGIGVIMKKQLLDPNTPKNIQILFNGIYLAIIAFGLNCISWIYKEYKNKIG